MTGTANRASLFYIKLNNPDQLNEVVDRMEKAFPGYRILPMKEYTTLMMSNYMSGLDAFIQIVVFIAIFIGVLVIFLSMYTTITERTREIGIFRSLGASKSFIVRLIFEETAAVCLVGVVIGVAGSFLIARGWAWYYPMLTRSVNEKYSSSENISRLFECGIWRCQFNIQPWIWRKLKKADKLKLKKSC